MQCLPAQSRNLLFIKAFMSLRNSQRKTPNHSQLAVFSILALAFLARLRKASGTFLNPDEALHALTAYQNSLTAAYKASLGLAHPPLLIIFLYFWRQLGTSELWLRLPSVLAGTVFCLFLFYWIKAVFGNTPAGNTPARLGFLFACFLPPMIELSAEVRQYALLLCFLAITAYLFEMAVSNNSARRLALSFFFLYLAMLTHYSALLFVAALGIYSLLRLLREKFSSKLIAVWITGQLAALALFAFLYKTHISLQRRSDQAQRALTESLPNSFFHHGHDHLLSFAFARTFGTFQFLCGQLAIGDIAGLIFLIGIVFLFRKASSRTKAPCPPSVVISSEAEKPAFETGKNLQNRPPLRLFAIFLLLPYALNCAVAYADLYPYGGTRHSAFISVFAIAGISYALTRIFAQHTTRTFAVVIITILVCQFLGSPHRPYMTRKDQSRVNMVQAIAAIHQQVPPGSLLFIDLQTNFLLQNYLCPTAIPDTTTLPGFWTYSCSGYQVVSTTPDQSIFTPQLLFKKWSDFSRTSAYHSSQPVWIFQAGWNIHLAEDLQRKSKSPLFTDSSQMRDFHPQTFGHNIALFRWM
jgi:hypothetical protein